MPLTWSAAAAAAVILILLYFFYHPEKHPPAAVQTRERLPDTANGRLRVLEAEELVRLLKLEPVLANIKANLGLSDENWRRDALPTLYAYIAFVQRLPASESHHHAGDGGLVRHTLDVAVLALTAAAARSWPPGAKTEDIARLGAPWRFGILTAALLHDIGKTLTGVNVELFEHAEDAQGSLWLPDAGNMAQNGGRWYRVSFPEHKAPYTLHTELAWTFFAAIVPASVRRWLAADDPKLLPALRQYLSGQHEGSPFADIIRKADMASTARDLKSGSRQRFATARRTPLIETVMETLVEMLAERGRWFSTASSAGGDLFRQGGTVYMVSKHVPDRIREFLKQTKHPAAPSFPSDNQRVFDTLLEYGAVLPNPADERRAVTAVDIAFTRSDGETRSQRFTMLAFKLETLYPDGNYPAEFAGSLNVSSDQSPAQRQDSADTAGQETETETAPQAAEIIIPADIPPPPRKRRDTETENRSENETEAASVPQARFMAAAEDLSEYREAPRQPENTHRPSEKLPAGQPENANNLTDTSGGIDALLAKHGLLDDDEETGAENETAAAQQAAAGQPERPSENTQKPSATALKRRPEKQEAGAANHSSPKPKKPQANSAAGLKVLQKLFDDGADSLPPQQDAAAGLTEIQAERTAKPPRSPRPVKVQNPDAAVPPPFITEEDRQPERPSENTAGQPETAQKPSEKPSERQPENTENGTNAADALAETRLRQQQDGRHFWMWLADGLADGSIVVNQSGAPVHFVAQGMLLVSPAIFRDYAGGVFNKNDENCPGVRAQRGFVALKLHKRSKRTALFNVETAKGSRKRLFYCYLVPEENLYHIIRADSRPPNNPDITIAEGDLLDAGLASGAAKES